MGLPGLEFYSPQNPATGIGTETFDPITLDPVLMAALAQVPPPFGPVLLPWKAATFLNLGPLRSRGVEAWVSHRVNAEVTAFANYSWQRAPEILEPAEGQIPYPVAEVGIPAANRFNAGVSYNGPRFLADVNVNYSDRALWTDVLGPEFHGFSDAFTLVNATFGMRFAEGRATLQIKGTNLLNQDVMHHVYGDILRRSVVLELRYFAP